MCKHIICLGPEWSKVKPNTNECYGILLKKGLDTIKDFRYEFSSYGRKIIGINLVSKTTKEIIRSLKKEMQGSDCLLLLFNYDYYINPWYQYEIEAACQLNMFILTIIPDEYKGIPEEPKTDDTSYAFVDWDLKKITQRIDLWNPLDHKKYKI